MSSTRSHIPFPSFHFQLTYYFRPLQWLRPTDHCYTIGSGSDLKVDIHLHHSYFQAVAGVGLDQRLLILHTT